MVKLKAPLKKPSKLKLDPKTLAKQVVLALYKELDLTPKPGLVDPLSCGSHKDMNYAMMRSAIEVLEPYFWEMAEISLNNQPSLQLRTKLAHIGREAEKAMFSVTGGVNTHKGAIWSLGLLVSAVALCASKVDRVSILSILQTAQKIALFADENAPKSDNLTHGRQVYNRYRVGGALQEARAGFPHIVKYALPVLYASRARGEAEGDAQINTLISLIAHLSDTCILYRAGEDVALEVQSLCKQMLAQGGYAQPSGQETFKVLEQFLLKHQASPGGSADLLAATLFLDGIEGVYHSTIE